jgi:alcohol dehydrogenase (cytochrome c)/quinohemoprotein ethanol dehydrogenase
LLCAVALLVLSVARAAAGSPATADEDWRNTGRTPDEQRHSTLASIDRDNVARLGLAAWYDIPTTMGQEATPVVADGVIYIVTDWSIVRALDARTAELRWAYDPGVRASLFKACCGPVNRGAVLWKDLVVFGALDGRLVALDRATGRPRWSVQTVEPTQPYTITGAPRLAGDLVLIGNGGADKGVRGYVTAYRADSGRFAWRFYTVPGAPGRVDGAASDRVLAERAAPTWAGRWWEWGGGGTVWDSMAYDPQLDLVYIGTGNGSPWNHGLRSAGRGDNLFLASIVALRAKTGEYAWHYQTTPAETWDFTATQHMILADLPVGQHTRRVLMQAPKNGYFYVLDRATGELLSADALVRMTWSTGVDSKTGRPIETPDARYYRTGKPFLLVPSGAGAHNWHPMAFDPARGLVYIPVSQLPVGYADGGAPSWSIKRLNTGVRYDFGMSSPDFPPAGWLMAWDPAARRIAWRTQQPGPSSGGVLSTAGGLVFQGNAAGEFAAYRADDGSKLWSFDAQTGIVAAPVSYSIAGEQSVAVLAGWGGGMAMAGGARMGALGTNRLLIFRLDARRTLPTRAAEVADARPHVPATGADDREIALGGDRYFVYCSACHGIGGVSGGVVPDLRFSALLSSPAWDEIVLRGALSEAGMTRFDDVLDARSSAAIRHYLIEQARQDPR